jgi:hypothetical protein
MEGNQEGDKWLGGILRRLPVTATDECLDAETLAAWSEGSLDSTRLSAVELHVSDCPRCMGMLAAMARTIPAEPPQKPSWAAGHVFRWLVPMTAAATAIAIWVMVPDRPVTRVQPAAAPRSEPSSVAEPPVAALERRANVAPTPAESLEKQTAPAAGRQDAAVREEDKREPAALETFSRPAAAPPPPPQPPSPAPAQAFDAPSQRMASLAAVIPETESIAASDPLIRWRVRGGTFVERSIDGGKTWIRASMPPGVAPGSTPARAVVSIRAVDTLRATIATSDGRALYTTDGGVSWEAVQENQAAPF